MLTSGVLLHILLNQVFYKHARNNFLNKSSNYLSGKKYMSKYLTLMSVQKFIMAFMFYGKIR